MAGSAVPRDTRRDPGDLPWRGRLAPVVALLAALLAAGAPALAQGAGGPRPSGSPPLPPFQCVGAENLEEDVFEVPFTAASDRLGDAARTPLALAAELLRREPDRNACILGHARREGGQQTSVNLAARRAGAVKDALLRAGLPGSRLRSEARVAGFSRTTGNPAARSVSIVIMPAGVPRPERVPPEPAAPQSPASQSPASRPAPDGTAPATPPTPAAAPAGARPAPAPPGPPPVAPGTSPAAPTPPPIAPPPGSDGALPPPAAPVPAPPIPTNEDAPHTR